MRVDAFDLTEANKGYPSIMCPAPVAAQGERGFIIPIGGGEDRVKEMQIHRKFVELSGGYMFTR